MPRAMYTRPITPAWSFSMPSRIFGLVRHCVPCCTIRWYLRAASTILRPSKMLWEQGFSTYTSLPAWQAQMVCRACQWLGVARATASMERSSSSLRKSTCSAGFLPVRFSASTAAACMRFSSQSHIATTSTCSPRAIISYSAWPIEFRPRPPSPAMATRSRSLAPARAMAGVANRAVPAAAAEDWRNWRRFALGMVHLGNVDGQ